MRNLLMATIALVVGPVGYSAAAWAQDTTQQPTSDSTGADKPFTISLTPRVWYRMGNENIYFSSPTAQSTTPVFDFADYGLSAEVSARSLPNWSFILTGYYGAGSAPFRGLEYLPSSFQNTVTGAQIPAVREDEGARAFNRYDVELLARYLVAPNISVTGGFRTLNFTEKLTSDYTAIFPNTQFPNAPEFGIQKVHNQFYLVEIGALFSTPFTASGRHLLFGGATLGLGAETSDQSNYFVNNLRNPSRTRASILVFATTLDTYVGYQFLITQSIALNIRYRAIMSTQREIPGTVVVNHGPEIGITTRVIRYKNFVDVDMRISRLA